MLNDCEQLMMDELTLEERSVFMYYFILKMSKKDIAKHLKISVKTVNSIVNYLTMEIDFLPLKAKLLEAYNLGF